jgi:hypothetical protein
MRITIASLLTVLFAGSLSFADDKSDAGWDKCFIDLKNYSRTFQKPVKGDKADVYQQTARYDWSGGRLEQIDITLARDPAFKEKYSADAMKDEKNPPKEIEINKKKAWFWDRAEQAKPGEVTRTLVVLLTDDKAIIIKQKGDGARIVDIAKMFDFDNVEKALANSPK